MGMQMELFSCGSVIQLPMLAGFTYLNLNLRTILIKRNKCLKPEKKKNKTKNNKQTNKQTKTKTKKRKEKNIKTANYQVHLIISQNKITKNINKQFNDLQIHVFVRFNCYKNST